MQGGKYLNLRIVKMMFMKKDKREFSCPKLTKRSFFVRSDILKTFSQLFTKQKPSFLFRKKSAEASKNSVRYHSDNRELKWHLTIKSCIYYSWMFQ